MESSLIGTSLSALDQINQAQQKSRKRLWAIVFTLATAFAVYQIIAIGSSFLQNSMNVIETQDIDKEDPSVTVCDNVYLSQNVTNVADEVIKVDENLLMKIKNLSSECDPWKMTLFCLSLLNERERFALGLPSEELFLIHYNDIAANEYSAIQSTFNNLYYGNCATFASKYIAQGPKIKIGKQFRVFHPFVLVIHESGTFPVFNAENVNYINAYDLYATYIATKVELKPQHWKLKSNCEELVDNNYTVYPDLNGYRYTYESCLDQCLYNLTKKYCNCILPKSMLEVNTQRLPICQQYCNKIPEELSGRMCNCKAPCSYVKYLFKPQFGSNDKSTSLIKYIIEDINPSILQLPKDRNLTFKDFRDELSRKGYDELTSYASNRQTIIVYKRQSLITSTMSSIKLEDVLSVLGGILGLWIGLSVTVLIHMPSTLLDKFRKRVFKNTKIQNIALKMSQVVWHCVFVCIAAIASYQIYITVADYYKYNVIQVSTTEDLDPSTFPSIFLCSGTQVHLSPTILNNPNLSHAVKYLGNHSHHKNSKYYHRKMTKADKILLLPQIDDLISTCQYQSIGAPIVNCTFNFHSIYLSKIYSNDKLKACITIRPPDSSKSLNINELQLKLKFPFDGLDRKEGKNEISFHPFFMRQLEDETDKFHGDFVSIHPGELIDIKYSVKQIRRMKSPYATDCVNETYDFAFWPLEFEGTVSSSSLAYNFEDCLQLCANYNNKTLFCDEIDMENLDSLEYGYCTTNLSVCECKQPCKENIYDFQITQSKDIYKENFMHRKQYKNYEDLVSFLMSGFSVVRLRKTSSAMKVLTEKPLIEDDSLIGLVGGILGLWIGSSIVSLFVEIQRIGAASVTKCKQIIARKTNRSR